MSQTLYGILALGLLMLVMLNMQRSIAGSANEQTYVELVTPVQGVATDVFEHIDRQYFDRYVAKHVADLVNDPYKTCGRVDDPAVFSNLANGSFYDSEDGALAQCSVGATPKERFEKCFYVEGFHGLASPAAPIEFDRDGYVYRVEDISVRYVVDSTLAASAAQTFAKEVELTITNPHLTGSSNLPLQMRFQRVFQYDLVTDNVLFPYYGKGFPCPPVPAYPIRHGM